MTELCFDSIKTKKKIKTCRRKKPMWKEKIEREISICEENKDNIIKKTDQQTN